MRFTPRAGIAEPRERLPMQPLTPLKPNVKEPAVWSWAAQQISESALYATIAGMAEEENPCASPWDSLTLHNDLSTTDDPALRREIYTRTITIINLGLRPSDGYSPYGAPIDRAHAKLLTWLTVFADYRK
jgi:hypothetical protein